MTHRTTARCRQARGNPDTRNQGTPIKSFVFCGPLERVRNVFSPRSKHVLMGDINNRHRGVEFRSEAPDVAVNELH